ncbi:MAG: CHAT domain-containing protein [Muribaculaceae bacterium]|nr:CHAT domain-containing protein [Muribaculaceae bacterium]
MKLRILFLLVLASIMPTASANLDGMKFGAALGKAGYGPSAVRDVANSISTICEMEAAGNYRSAAMASAALVGELDKIAEVKDTKVYGDLLRKTGLLMHSAGLPSSALYYGLRDEEFRRLHFPKSDERVHAVVNLVVYYCTLRDFPKTREWIACGYELTRGRKKMRDSEAELLNNEALLCYHEGDFDEAIRLENMALAVSPTDLRQQNLLTFLKAAGRYGEVIDKQRAMAEACESAGYTGGMQYARRLNELAVALYDNGSHDMDEIISLSKRAESLYKANKQTLSAEYATLLGNIAFYHDRRDDTKSAIAYALRAKNIIDELADNATSYLVTHNSKQLAALHFKNGDYPAAAAEAMRYCAVDMGNTVYTMIASTKEARDAVWKSNSNWYLNFLPLLALKAGDGEASALAYDALLLGKGILLNAEKSTAAYAESGGKTTRRLYARWEAAKKAASEAYTAEDLEKTEREAKRSEQELMDSLLHLPAIRREYSHDWREIAERLGEGEAAVEMAEVTLPDSSRCFVAAAITRGCTAPAMVQLASADELLDTYDISPADPKLWTMTIGRITEAVPDAARIYFSPSGILHFVPLESLGGEGAPELVRLSSTRELLRDRRGTLPATRAALFGGIDYTTSTDADAPATQKSSRDYASRVRSLREGAFVLDSLPGTRREVNMIADILGNARTTVFTDDNATETAVSAAAASDINTMHISTHGFYCTPSDVAAAGWSAMQANGSNTGADEALYRTGLFMAGAAQALTSDATADPANDGILTAAEIAGMQLGNLDLIVLSACETGLGDITGDGVFGLQRGLKKAGAGAVMMSLWKVADDATSVLMAEFYRRLASGTKPQAALAAAKSAVRAHPDWSDPYFWAPFVLLDAE